MGGALESNSRGDREHGIWGMEGGRESRDVGHPFHGKPPPLPPHSRRSISGGSGGDPSGRRRGDGERGGGEDQDDKGRDRVLTSNNSNNNSSSISSSIYKPLTDSSKRAGSVPPPPPIPPQHPRPSHPPPPHPPVSGRPKNAALGGGTGPATTVAANDATSRSAGGGRHSDLAPGRVKRVFSDGFVPSGPAAAVVDVPSRHGKRPKVALTASALDSQGHVKPIDQISSSLPSSGHNSANGTPVAPPSSSFSSTTSDGPGGSKIIKLSAGGLSSSSQGHNKNSGEVGVVANVHSTVSSGGASAGVSAGSGRGREGKHHQHHSHHPNHSNGRKSLSAPTAASSSSVGLSSGTPGAIPLFPTTPAVAATVTASVSLFDTLRKFSSQSGGDNDRARANAQDEAAVGSSAIVGGSDQIKSRAQLEHQSLSLSLPSDTITASGLLMRSRAEGETPSGKTPIGSSAAAGFAGSDGAVKMLANTSTLLLPPTSLRRAVSAPETGPGLSSGAPTPGTRLLGPNLASAAAVAAAAAGSTSAPSIGSSATPGSALMRPRAAWGQGLIRRTSSASSAAAAIAKPSASRESSGDHSAATGGGSVGSGMDATRIGPFSPKGPSNGVVITTQEFVKDGCADVSSPHKTAGGTGNISEQDVRNINAAQSERRGSTSEGFPRGDQSFSSNNRSPNRKNTTSKPLSSPSLQGGKSLDVKREKQVDGSCPDDDGEGGGSGGFADADADGKAVQAPSDAEISDGESRDDERKPLSSKGGRRRPFPPPKGSKRKVRNNIENLEGKSAMSKRQLSKDEADCDAGRESDVGKVKGDMEIEIEEERATAAAPKDGGISEANTTAVVATTNGRGEGVTALESDDDKKDEEDEPVLGPKRRASKKRGRAEASPNKSPRSPAGAGGGSGRDGGGDSCDVEGGGLITSTAVTTTTSSSSSRGKSAAVTTTAAASSGGVRGRSSVDKGDKGTTATSKGRRGGIGGGKGASSSSNLNAMATAGQAADNPLLATAFADPQKYFSVVDPRTFIPIEQIVQQHRSKIHSRYFPAAVTSLLSVPATTTTMTTTTHATKTESGITKAATDTSAENAGAAMSPPSVSGSALLTTAHTTSRWQHRYLVKNAFSRDSDRLRAVNTIYYMAELHRSINEFVPAQDQTAISSHNARLLLTEAGAGVVGEQILVPPSYDIAQAVDLLDQHVDVLYNCLKNIREKQYMSESKHRYLMDM